MFAKLLKNSVNIIGDHRMSRISDLRLAMELSDAGWPGACAPAILLGSKSTSHCSALLWPGSYVFPFSNALPEPAGQERAKFLPNSIIP